MPFTLGLQGTDYGSTSPDQPYQPPVNATPAYEDGKVGRMMEQASSPRSDHIKARFNGSRRAELITEGQ